MGVASAVFQSLPLELLELIITQNHDDKDTLKACSTVCHALLPVCQKYIFRKINLDPIHSSEQAYGCSALSHRKFSHLVANNSRIASCVRELDFLTTFRTSDGRTLLHMGRYSQHQDVVPFFLSKSPRLETLHLHFDRNVSWNSLSTNVKAALHHVVRLSTLRHLGLHSESQLSIPLSFFHSVLNVTSLKLRHINVSDELNIGAMENRRARLNSLDLPNLWVHEIHPLFHNQRSPFDLTRLVNLDCYLDRGSREMLRLCGSSLKHLKCGIVLGPTGNLDGIFADLMSLTTLVITQESLTRQLPSLPSPNLLESLTVSISLPICKLGTMVSDWMSELDSLLHQFTSLRKVEISVRLYGWGRIHAFQFEFETMVKARMPDTLKRAILSAQVE